MPYPFNPEARTVYSFRGEAGYIARNRRLSDSDFHVAAPHLTISALLFSRSVAALGGVFEVLPLPYRYSYRYRLHSYRRKYYGSHERTGTPGKRTVDDLALHHSRSIPVSNVTAGHNHRVLGSEGEKKLLRTAFRGCLRPRVPTFSPTAHQRNPPPPSQQQQKRSHSFLTVIYSPNGPRNANNLALVVAIHPRVSSDSLVYLIYTTISRIPRPSADART